MRGCSVEHVQTYSLALLRVINHSHSFGWAQTCKTVDFSSLICSGPLFGAHTSYQRPGVLEWHTDISLTEEEVGGGNGPHHFTAPISTHLKTTSGRITACPAVNYYQLFVGQGKPPDLTVAGAHRDGPTDGAFSWLSH